MWPCNLGQSLLMILLLAFSGNDPRRREGVLPWMEVEVQLPPGVARDPPSPQQPAGHSVGTIQVALPHWAPTLRAGSDLSKARWGGRGPISRMASTQGGVQSGARLVICGRQGPLSFLSAVGTPRFQKEVARKPRSHLWSIINLHPLFSFRLGDPHSFEDQRAQQFNLPKTAEESLLPAPEP